MNDYVLDQKYSSLKHGFYDTIEHGFTKCEKARACSRSSCRVTLAHSHSVYENQLQFRSQCVSQLYYNILINVIKKQQKILVDKCHTVFAF